MRHQRRTAKIPASATTRGLRVFYIKSTSTLRFLPECEASAARAPPAQTRQKLEVSYRRAAARSMPGKIRDQAFNDGTDRYITSA